MSVKTDVFGQAQAAVIRQVRPVYSTVASPRPLLLASWLIYAALLLVFAGDIADWSRASDSRVAPLLAAPAQALNAVATGAGLDDARQVVERAVFGVYDRPLVLGGAPTLAQSAALSQAMPPAEQIAAAAKPAPKRILIVGASSIQEGLGTELERTLKKYNGLTIQREGRFNSGLAQPDYFDWNKELATLINQFKPDMIIAQWGGNDTQSLAAPDGSFVAKFGTSEWDAEYGKRVAAMMKLMQQNGCHAVMLGMPNMRQKSFAAKIERLNSVTQIATEAAGGTFVSLWKLSSDSKGKYAAMVNIDGQQKPMRAADGIHFSSFGAEYMAELICGQLEITFTLGK